MGESENVEKKVYDIIASSGSSISALLQLTDLPNNSFFNSKFTNGISNTKLSDCRKSAHAIREKMDY